MSASPPRRPPRRRQSCRRRPSSARPSRRVPVVAVVAVVVVLCLCVRLSRLSVCPVVDPVVVVRPLSAQSFKLIVKALE